MPRKSAVASGQYEVKSAERKLAEARDNLAFLQGELDSFNQRWKEFLE
jgi:hypothetical protein